MLMILLTAALIIGDTLRVSWDANIENDLAGYKLYHGFQSRVYSDTIDVNDTTATMFVVANNKTYHYFAVTAYDTAGNESDFSNELKWPVLLGGDSISYNSIELIRPFGNRGTSVFGDTLVFWGDNIDTIFVKSPSRFDSSLYNIKLLAMNRSTWDTTAQQEYPILRVSFNDWHRKPYTDLVIDSLRYYETTLSDSGNVVVAFVNDMWVPNILDLNVALLKMTVIPQQSDFDKFDINADGVIDVMDWFLLLRLMGTTSLGKIFNLRADLNGDNRVDGRDKSLFARLYR